MTDTREEPENRPADDLSAAADRIRETAKWLLIAFAAVGVTLFGGLQLASIGKLNDYPWRLAMAAWGVAFGFIGIGIAIHSAGSVVTRSHASLKWLNERKEGHRAAEKATQAVGTAAEAVRMAEAFAGAAGDAEEAARKAMEAAYKAKEAALKAKEAVEMVKAKTARGDSAGIRAEIETDKSLMGGKKTIDDLIDAIEKAHKNRLAAYEGVYGDRARADDEQAKLNFVRAEKRLKTLQGIEKNIVGVASFMRLRNAYERARTWMFVGAGLAAIGITLFAWGTQPPAPVAASQVVPKGPSNVTLIFDKKASETKRVGKQSLQEALGSDCPLNNVSAVAVDAQGDTYHVVSIRTAKCNSIYFTVTWKEAKVIPRMGK